MSSMGSVSRLLAYALAALLVNSAYLAARADASLFYYSNVALHAIGGIAVALLALYSFSRVPRPARAGVIVLLAAAVGGLYLSIVGATRSHRMAFTVHAALGLAGAAALWAPGVAALIGRQSRARRIGALTA